MRPAAIRESVRGNLEEGAKAQLAVPLKEARPTKVEFDAEAGEEQISATLEATVVRGTSAPVEAGRVYRISKKK